MKHAYIRDLSEHEGEEVLLRGWLYNRRSSGRIHFLQIRDGTGAVQAVMLKKAVGPDTFLTAGTLPIESSLHLQGLVRADDRAPGGVEIEAVDLTVVSEAEEYPITPKEHGVAFLMQHRHLWLRSRIQAAILRVRHETIRAIRDFFDSRGFVCTDAPVFTPAACEETSTLFPVKYFDEIAYLTQSGQLYAEAAAMALGRVYTFGPTFRAEKSKTRKHLTEFWMVEPEVAFAGLEDVILLAEDCLAHVARWVLENSRADLDVLERDTKALEKVVTPFPRISYDDAVKAVNAAGVDMAFGDDFGAPQEEALAAGYDRPVVVHRFPASIKAFYMKRDPEAPDLALCVDVIAPEGYGELIGGSEREDDLGELEKRIDEQGLPREAFAWYLDLRRFGSVPHGGFGLGLERTVAWLCGISHIRQTIPFPRMLGKIYP
jgi:asparaginyl-tRNA synthetase